MIQRKGKKTTSDAKDAAFGSKPSGKKKKEKRNSSMGSTSVFPAADPQIQAGQELGAEGTA